MTDHEHQWEVTCIVILDCANWRASAEQFNELCWGCGSTRRRLEAPSP